MLGKGCIMVNKKKVVSTINKCVISCMKAENKYVQKYSGSIGIGRKTTHDDEYLALIEDNSI